jgi:hypothetical protein
MKIFIIAILIGIMIQSLSNIIMNIYHYLGIKEETLSGSLIYNSAALVYVLNRGVMIINVTILGALIIKHYIL